MCFCTWKWKMTPQCSVGLSSGCRQKPLYTNSWCYSRRPKQKTPSLTQENHNFSGRMQDKRGCLGFAWYPLSFSFNSHTRWLFSGECACLDHFYHEYPDPLISIVGGRRGCQPSRGLEQNVYTQKKKTGSYRSMSCKGAPVSKRERGQDWRHVGLCGERVIRSIQEYHQVRASGFWNDKNKIIGVRQSVWSITMASQKGKRPLVDPLVYPSV